MKENADGRRRITDRLLTFASVLGLLAILLAIWNASWPLRSRFIERLQLRQRSRLVASIIRNYSGDAVVGDQDAAHTILLFSNYACPACRTANTLLLASRDVQDRFRVVVFQFPTFPTGDDESITAAKGAICADRFGRFGEFNEKLVAVVGPITKQSVLAVGADASDIERREFEACIDSRVTADALASHRALGERLGVTGPPTFVTTIGTRLVGVGAVVELGAFAR